MDAKIHEWAPSHGHLEKNYTALYVRPGSLFPRRAFHFEDEQQYFPGLTKLCNGLGFRHMTGYANTINTAVLAE
jgi:hypothetical protein